MLFHNSDYIVLSYLDVNAAMNWWKLIFECKPRDWPIDCPDPLENDVALDLTGGVYPAIILRSRLEAGQAQTVTEGERPIIFTGKIEKAHKFLEKEDAMPGSIQQEGGTKFFNIQDTEGHTIEICLEP